MVKLTAEQQSLLISIGRPDDGSRKQLTDESERLTAELVDLGLIDFTGMNFLGRECYDLTDAGESLFEGITG